MGGIYAICDRYLFMAMADQPHCILRGLCAHTPLF